MFPLVYLSLNAPRRSYTVGVIGSQSVRSSSSTSSQHKQHSFPYPSEGVISLMRATKAHWRRMAKTPRMLLPQLWAPSDRQYVKWVSTIVRIIRNPTRWRSIHRPFMSLPLSTHYARYSLIRVRVEGNRSEEKRGGE